MDTITIILDLLLALSEAFKAHELAKCNLLRKEIVNTIPKMNSYFDRRTAERLLKDVEADAPYYFSYTKKYYVKWATNEPRSPYFW